MPPQNAPESRSLTTLLVQAAGPPESKRRLGFEAAAVAALCLAFAAIVYRVWAVAMRIPFHYGGDANLHMAYAKRMTESTWYLRNDRLGAPHGLDASDFPLGGENLHWLAMKVIGFFTQDPGAILNLYLLGTYALIGATTYLVARLIGLRRWTAVTIAVLYAFLPYHQYRGVDHALRSGYYAVPFVLLAIPFVAGWRRRFTTTDPSEDQPRAPTRNGIILLGAYGLVMGASDTQNAVYISIVLVLVGAAASLGRRRLAPLALAVLFTACAGLSLVINNAPFVITTLAEGSNTDVATRPLDDQERYALRPAGMVLPVRNHRVEPLADIRARVQSEAPYQEGTESLGLIAAAGLIASLAAAGTLAMTRRSVGRIANLGVMGMLSAMLALIAAPHGFSFLLSIGGFTMLRTWNRVSLLIALFALLSVAILAEVLADRLRESRRKVRTVGASVAAAMLIVVGVSDQVATRGVVQSEVARLAFARDRDFFEAVEAHAPPDASIFQYPVIRFPEGGPIGTLPDYETLTGYLHTDQVAWSTAPIRGRPASYWQFALTSHTNREQVLLLAAAGFDGVVIHERGLVGGLRELPAALDDLVGPPTLTEPDRQLLYYDLAPLRQEIAQSIEEGDNAAIALAITEPVRIEFDSNAYHLETSEDGAFRWIAANEVELTLTNDGHDARSVHLGLTFRHIQGNIDQYRVSVDGRPEELVTSEDGEARFEQVVSVPPGGMQITVGADGGEVRPPTGGDSRTMGLQVANHHAYDPVVGEFLCNHRWLTDDARICLTTP